MSGSLRPPGLQHAKIPCLSLSPGVCSNLCPLSWWWYLTISSSVSPFFSCSWSFPATGSFSVSWLFTSGGQSIGDSTSESVLPMNIQSWLPLGLTGLISFPINGKTDPPKQNKTKTSHLWFGGQIQENLSKIRGKGNRRWEWWEGGDNHGNRLNIKSQNSWYP